MRTIYVTLAALTLVLFLVGCANNIPTSPGNKKGSGNLTLNIDKATTPLNVMEVMAYLSRAGYDTLSGKLNVLTNTSADISFSDVAAGTWHLRVDAIDSDSTVVYTGETDVDVKADVVTDVSLTLLPTGQGKGSIYIVVNWGTQSPIWIDYKNNPVMTLSDNPSGALKIMEPKVYYDNGTYKMWYASLYNSAKFNVWYAESSDGIHWQNRLNPVFVNGTPGSWDDYTVLCGAIIKKSDNQYLMYYNGDHSQDGPWQIGMATSSDGIQWNRLANPVVRADIVNNYWLGVISVLNVNGKYYMYYDSAPRDNREKVSINLATSTDGINWTKYADNPILSPSESWDGVGVSYPAVIYDNNRFVMIYNNTDRTKFGIAFSSDGINWNKSSEPTFTVNNTSQKTLQINYPFLMKVGNGYRLYYNATMPDNTSVINFAYSSKLN